MKKLLSIISLVLLVGCSTLTPVQRSWPDAPPSLRKPCDPLKTAETDTKDITELLKIVVENYAIYTKCSGKVEEWNQWYNKQKEIFEKQ